MFNLARKAPARHWTLAYREPGRERRLIEPVQRHGLKVMSAGFIVGEDQPMAWDAELVKALISQLLGDVVWGDLDFLLVDLPPGTATVQQTIVSMTPLAGALIVVTPQDVAHLDARKAVEMLRLARVEIIGGVENMSGLVCPHCHDAIDVFHPVRPERSIWAQGVEKLAEFPLDPEVSRATDSGHPVMLARPESPRAETFRQLAFRIAEHVGADLPQPGI